MQAAHISGLAHKAESDRYTGIGAQHWMHRLCAGSYATVLGKLGCASESVQLPHIHSHT